MNKKFLGSKFFFCGKVEIPQEVLCETLLQKN